MKNRAFMLAACLASCLTAVPAARALRVSCDKSREDVNLAIIFANGVFTDISGAQRSLEALRPLVDAKLEHDPYTMAYGIAFNQKKGFLFSLYKLVKERLSMSVSEVIRILNGSTPVPANLEKSLRQFSAELDQAGFTGDQSLEKQVAIYRDHLRSGRKVLVVAHSEGNFYTNAAYQRLFETALPTPGRSSFGIVGVALPAPKVYDLDPPVCPSACDVVAGIPCIQRGCYTTLAEDLVVAFVHANFPGTAPANASGALITAGAYSFAWHGFSQSYLATASAREQILDQIANVAAALGPLEAQQNDNEIAASLEWDAPADLDLHVYEQFKRDHVYWLHKMGAGTLDRDAREGPGLEHYNTTCAALEPGDFRFAVGYYSGEGPVDARLQIKVGSAVRSFEVELEEPLGEGSIQHPQDVAVIHVPDREKYDKNDNRLIDAFDVEITPSSVRN